MEETYTTEVPVEAVDPATTAAVAGIGMAYLGVLLVVGIVMVVAMWKMFVKAGKPGWASLVPFYSWYVLLQIVGRPAWWLLLLFIPFINIVPLVIVSLDLAKSFGKDEVFGVLALFLFQPVGYAMLGFGQAQYKGPSAAAKAAA